MHIQHTQLSDLSKVALCHRQAFPNALSAQMGNEFVRKMLEWYVVSERGILIHINDDTGTTVGYLGAIITKEPGLMGSVSSISQYAFSTFVKSYFLKPWLFFHKENLKKFPYAFKNILIRMGIKSTLKTIPQYDLTSFKPFLGLVVIGVRKEDQGKGFGSLLLSEFEKLAKNTPGIQRIQLSVKSENIKAIKAYVRNGWLLTKEESNKKQFSKEL